jgi:hypothetical protein
VVQVPLSSVCSAAAAAAADLETYVMRQSPRIPNQLVTLNSRTFDVAETTLTPAMVTRAAHAAAVPALIHRPRDSRRLRPSPFYSRRTCTAAMMQAPSSPCCGSTGGAAAHGVCSLWPVTLLQNAGCSRRCRMHQGAAVLACVETCPKQQLRCICFIRRCSCCRCRRRDRV